MNLVLLNLQKVPGKNTHTQTPAEKDTMDNLNDSGDTIDHDRSS